LEAEFGRVGSGWIPDQQPVIVSAGDYPPIGEHGDRPYPAVVAAKFGRDGLILGWIPDQDLAIPSGGDHPLIGQHRDYNDPLGACKNPLAVMTTQFSGQRPADPSCCPLRHQPDARLRSEAAADVAG
jgi:hypothetical protein